MMVVPEEMIASACQMVCYCIAVCASMLAYLFVLRS
jgi:hypothetical protein